jgi:DNA-directed RNA polymerase subunit M/transcription elongation factor TFIIS
MQLVKLNACPKCGGALVISENKYGKRLVCLNCAWEKDLEIDQPLPKVYNDAEVERVGVADGCAVSSSCSSCPLEDCLFERPHTRRTLLWDQDALEVFAQHQHLGTTRAVAATAQKLAVSERRVYWALKRRAA